jgi:hypothetical protein
MSSEQNRSGEPADRPRPTRAQRIVAAGFLGAFGLTIITVLLTGLAVRAPHLRARSEPPARPPATVEQSAPVAPQPLAQPGSGAQVQREPSADADDPDEHATDHENGERPPARAR